MDGPLWPGVKESLKSYDVQSNRAVPIGPSAYRLEGATRMYNVRVLPLDQAQARLTVADEAAAGGLMRVERPLKNRFAERIPLFDEERGLLVSPHWDGEPLAVTPSDVHAAGTTLARLHAAMSDGGATTAVTQPVSSVKERYGTWQTALARALQLFETELSLAASRLRGDDTVRWQDALKGFITASENALEQLEGAQYRACSEAAQEAGKMAWNGLRLNQFTRLPSGAIAVSQSQTPVRDAALYDLACLARDIAEAGYAAGVEDLLRAYGSQLPLFGHDSRIVRAYAAFPHLGIQMVRQVQRQPSGNLDEWYKAAKRHQAASNTLLKTTG
jgi:hypothetical protein